MPSKANGSSEAPKLTVVVRIEKGGRGGKIVTVIEGFPRAPHLLEKLSREFKARLGTGGTCGIGEKGGYLEVQGDQRERVRGLLREKGIGSKG